MKEVCVVYTSKKSIGMFEYLLHFKAVQLSSGDYKIIDSLGMGDTVELSKEEFESNFVVIDEKDYKKYERYIYNGETDLIEKYLERIIKI